MLKTTNVCKLRIPRWHDILMTCIDAFNNSAPLHQCTLEQLVGWCNIKVDDTVTRDEVWKILWGVSNLQLRYVPKHDALRWDGKTFEDKAWAWSIKQRDIPQEEIIEELP